MKTNIPRKSPRILTSLLICPISMINLVILKDVNDMLFNLMSKIHLTVPKKPCDYAS